MSQEDRSEALIDVLEELEQSEIGFVLVGGYAISQFETRFSTDLDIVIAPDDHDDVVSFLESRGFERTADFEVPPEETIYNREIEQFERTPATACGGQSGSPLTSPPLQGWVPDHVL